jgi:hypothetical protein
MSDPNFKQLDPRVRRLVVIRKKLAETKKLPQNYENNLEVQKLSKRLREALDNPKVKPQLLKG